MEKEKAEKTDGDILSGSPQVVTLGGEEYMLRQPPRRWAREMRTKAIDMKLKVAAAGDDAAKVMDVMEDLFDFILTHPSLEDAHEIIDANVTDAEAARTLTVVINQVTVPLVAAVGAMTKKEVTKKKARAKKRRARST